jgi:voltage-gated potassium channel
MYPVTVGGRIFSFVVLMVGLSLVAVPAGLIASAMERAIESEENDGKETK